ncbi:ABC transporter permease subunit [Paenibacillus sp. LMG 31461]|uniref:ABC transporter permease subunit n=1 Tax=Paenibacillus plantarum TaxID=2654975 RepID=A0ABX1XDQ1_9BACL|nr:sugar ABC transporter permease [Paenibacillus plantarum]NOU66079.1 ABC transporter permease subunit [Paenibacillus plantarum]
MLASKFIKTFKRNGALLFLTLPMVVYVFIFNYLPMGGIIVAFKNYRYDLGIIHSHWAGLNNFKFFFTSPDAWRITINTLGYNAMFIILGLIIPVALALVLFEIRNRTMLKVYQTMMFFPHFLSWVVVAFMVYAFLNPLSGLLNQWFQMAGFNPIDWYVKSNPWVIILPLAQIWKTVGMSTLIYYASLMGIDNEYFEAAAIEGASKGYIALKITLPFLYPLMIMLTILAIGHIFYADFGLFYQLTMNSTMLYSTTDVIDTYVFRALRETGNIGMASAADFYKSFVGLFLVLTTNYIVRKRSPENALF